MGSTCWRITGINPGGGFTLTGTLTTTGSFGGDSSLVQIDVGFVTPSDNQGPLTSNVYVMPDPVILNGDATVKATVDDTNTGGNMIGSAQYCLNEGCDNNVWSPMAAEDGVFDQVEKYVETTSQAFVLGGSQVCVRGTEVLGNVGDLICQFFLVTYKFDGFLSPIENGVVNVAKAGQAIPAKWRLTDASDVPISDPGNLAGIHTSVNTYTGGERPTQSMRAQRATRLVEKPSPMLKGATG